MSNSADANLFLVGSQEGEGGEGSEHVQGGLLLARANKIGSCHHGSPHNQIAILTLFSTHRLCPIRKHSLALDPKRRFQLLLFLCSLVLQTPRTASFAKVVSSL
jgi:hypothetical protein